MSKLTMLSFNTLYADREGNLFYARMPESFLDVPRVLNGRAFCPEHVQGVWTEFYPFGRATGAKPSVCLPADLQQRSLRATVGEGTRNRNSSLPI